VNIATQSFRIPGSLRLGSIGAGSYIIDIADYSSPVRRIAWSWDKSSWVRRRKWTSVKNEHGIHWPALLGEA
jgi:hypothetical protein